MPNVVGLNPAPDLLATLTPGVPSAYGPHASVLLTGHMVSLLNGADVVIATVDFGREKPRAKADLRAIDGDTVTAVNALLRPYGRVKSYWRNPGEYRWHPHNGAPSAPTGVTFTPKVAAAPAPAPVANPALAPAAVVQPRVHIQVQAGGASGVTLIGTEKRHVGKPIVVKAATKSYSQMGKVILPHGDLKTLETAWSMRQKGRPTFVKITGPAGTAKTMLAEQFAFSKGVPFLLVEGQSIQTAADWYGGFVPQAGGSFQWVWSDFALALRRGEPMVILIDELNRTENERALNGLMGLLAWTGMVTPLGAPEPIRLAPGILVMATINEGVEFVGTVEIDAAVNSRFAMGIRMGYMPEAVETKVLLQQAPGLDRETAKRLVKVAAIQRGKRDLDEFPSHNIISARDLIEIGNAVLDGMTPSEALWANAKSRFIPEDDKALEAIIESQFGPMPEPLDSLADDDDIEQMLAADD